MSPPSTPDIFPSEDMFDSLVTIHVGTGEDQRTFKVFEGVLCFYSGYFQAAFHGHFREAAEGVLSLPTEDPLIFELFRQWIHTRRFYEESTLEPGVLMDYMTLAKLWVFGDAHEIPMLQNEVADVLCYKTLGKSAPPYDVLEFIKDHTFEGSALRQALVLGLQWAYTAYLPRLACGDCFDYWIDFFSVDHGPWPFHISDSERGWLRRRQCERHLHSQGVQCQDAK